MRPWKTPRKCALVKVYTALHHANVAHSLKQPTHPQTVEYKMVITGQTGSNQYHSNVTRLWCISSEPAQLQRFQTSRWCIELRVLSAACLEALNAKCIQSPCCPVSGLCAQRQTVKCCWHSPTLGVRFESFKDCNCFWFRTKFGYSKQEVKLQSTRNSRSHTTSTPSLWLNSRCVPSTRLSILTHGLSTWFAVAKVASGASN